MEARQFFSVYILFRSFVVLGSIVRYYSTATAHVHVSVCLLEYYILCMNSVCTTPHPIQRGIPFDIGCMDVLF